MNTFQENPSAVHIEQQVYAPNGQGIHKVEWSHAPYGHQQQAASSQPQCMCPSCTVSPYFTFPESPYAQTLSPGTPVDYFFQDSPNGMPAPPAFPPQQYGSGPSTPYEMHCTAQAAPHAMGMMPCSCEACMCEMAANQGVLPHTLSPMAVEFYPGSTANTPQEYGTLPPPATHPYADEYCDGMERPRRASNAVPRDAPVTDDAFEKVLGNMFDIARTSGGSSFLQACLKDREHDRFNIIHAELEPHFSELLLDSHGCYVMRSLMEMMTPEKMQGVLKTLAADEQLVFSLCTHSLHTRRIVQYLLETAKVEACQFIVDVMMKKCKEIATTQQGCIAMQRVMDCAADEQRAILYATIYEHLTEFAHDPFANYVVQYILENGDKSVTSAQVWARFEGHVTALACNKFASNVVEKALHHTCPEVQHLIVSELYLSNSTEFLQNMLQDSFGNYIIQATIALCSFKDVWMISERLKPILHTTPYGYKIAARLERRLKGKPLTNARTVSYNHSQHLRS